MMTLKRVSILPDGAFGVLLWHRVPFAVTLERTYDGQRGTQQVKIPPGEYICFRDRYHKGGYDTWGIPVPGHKYIKFHMGNIEDDLDGCVAVGEEFDPFRGKTGILRSGEAFKEMMTLTADVDELQLLVVNT